MPQEKLVNIKLSEIKPNPNRDLKFNPFNEEKIAALMASIGETGFWTNVIVRKSPDDKSRGKWLARYSPQSKRSVYIGRFSTKKEATQARKAATISITHVL